jgi:hypothetical protein
MSGQLGFVNTNERTVMKQKVLRSCLPSSRVALIINLHSAAWNDEVNVRMIDHRITTPGVQHSEEAEPATASSSSILN